MRRLLFQGNPKDTLIVDGEIVRGGESFEVDDEVADRLLADPHAQVNESYAVTGEDATSEEDDSHE